MEEEARKSGSGRDESEDARLDRNMNELLQELRVSQAGVQILFAFLLTLPFTQRFTTVTSLEKDVYFITLLSTAAAAALFIAPVSFHRLLFRRQEKAYLISTSNWMAIGGLACLAVAMVGVVLLITDFIFSGVAAVVVGGCFALVFVFLWYILPLTRLWRHQRKFGPN
jgi:O-antigen/teichoic acid export membrane protein